MNQNNEQFNYIKIKLSNEKYDILKWIALIVLPSIEFLYDRLNAIWNFPYGDQISSSLVAFDIFLGILIGISTFNYKKSSSEKE